MAWGDGAGIADALTCNDVDGGQKITEAGTEEALANSTSESLTVQGLAAYPSSGLGGGRSLTCAFSSAVGQTEVRETTAVDR